MDIRFGQHPMSRVTRFIIVFGGRTGSTLLIEQLQSQPAIAAEMERMTPLKRAGAEAQIAWLRRFYAGPFEARVRAVGFKVKPWDILDPERTIALLREQEVRVIHLTRLNHVKWALSEINARRLHRMTGRWARFHEHERIEPASISVKEIFKWIRSRERAVRRVQEMIRAIDLPTLSIAYEDVAFATTQTLERIGAFLGCDVGPVRTPQVRSRKVTPDDLAVAIRNHAQILAAYRGTRYEPMLRSGPPSESRLRGSAAILCPRPAVRRDSE